MRRAYAVLIAVLVVVVIAFTFARSYLSRLGASHATLQQEIRRQELIDSLHATYEKMLQSDSSHLKEQFDSLCAESNALIYALESQLDLYINREYDLLLQTDSSGHSDLSASSNDVTDEYADSLLTPTEYEIYIAYLEMNLRLPKDLSSYEKKVETREVKKELMERFSISDDQLEEVLLKARQRSMAGTRSG